MNDFEELLRLAEEVWNKAPDEIKQFAPEFLKAVGQIGPTAFHYFKNVKPLIKLCNLLNNNTCLDSTSATCTLNDANHILCVAENYDDFFNRLTTMHDSDHSAQLNELHSALSKSANWAVGIGALTSFVLIVFETINLYNFWNKVKDARNLVKESQKNKELIAEAFINAKKEIRILNDLTIKYAETYGELTKMQIIRQIDNTRRSLNDLQQYIRNLEVKIGNEIIRIGSSRDQRIGSALSVCLQGISSSANLAALYKFTHPAIVVSSLTTIILSFVISAANVALYNITSKDIDDLRKELEKISEIESERKRISDSFEEMALQAWQTLESGAAYGAHAN